MLSQRVVGRTDITVSEVSLGCGNFGGIGSAPELFGRGESQDAGLALLDAAWGLGVTSFDTADAYGGGRSESTVGAWLRSRREPAVVTTKVFHSVVGDPADRGLAPERIARQVRGSLERLGLDRIDLYLMHAPDPETPLSDTLVALDSLVRAGTVRAVGASNVDARFLDDALRIASDLGLSRIECVQNEYHLLSTAAADDVLALCREQQIGFAAFSPLAGGWLTGKYRRGELPPDDSRMRLRPGPYEHLVNDATFDALEQFEIAAKEHGVDPGALALAWVLGEPGVTTAIVGPRRPAHLDVVSQAVGLRLGSRERADIADLFRDLGRAS